jgi:hypothetical protein
MSASLGDPDDWLRYPGQSDVQTHHLPADDSIVDTQVIGH